MDPAGLLLRIANPAYNLGKLCEIHSPMSFPILFSIRTQVVILQTGVQRIQEWLHFTDPASKSQVLPSLHQAIQTVDATVQRLNECVDSLAKLEQKSLDQPGGSDSDTDHDERSLQKHLTDVRECASLIHLTLSVCQLPIGQSAEREVRELEIGAKTLRRVQTSSNRERRELIENFRHDGENEHSADYDSFLISIMDAEADLPRHNAQEAARYSPQSFDHQPHEQAVPAAISLKLESVRPPEQDASSATDEPAELEALVSPLTSAIGPSWSASETPRSSATSTSSAGDTMLSRSSTIGTLEPKDITPTRTPTATAGSGSTLPLVPPKSLAGDTRSNLASPPIEKLYAQLGNAHGSKEKAYGHDEASEFLPPPLPGKETIYGAAATSPQTSSTHDVMDKITSLKQSLMALGATDAVNVELDQPPIQPYVDNPPSYVSESDAALPSRTSPLIEMRRTSTVTIPLDQSLSYAMRLVREDRTQELRRALARGRNANTSDPANGRTLIMEAARLRRQVACQILLQAGSRLHLKDTQGNTALHLSAQQGDATVCQVLLDGGASRLECNAEGKTPLELAAGSGNSEVVLCLLNNMLPYQAHEAAGPILLKAFLEAVRLGDITTAQILLSKDVEPDKIRETWKPIAYAAQSGSIAMLDLIIGQNCCLKATSPDGWTALHFAANHGHLSMVERLMTLRLSRKSRTRRYRETALHLAAAAGHTSTALALITHKNTHVIMAQDVNDQEPIHHAVRVGDMKLASTLMAQGVKLKNTTKFGWKPIHLATAYGHARLVADLMTRGISLEEKLEKPASKAEKGTNDAARRGYSAEIRWPHPGARPLHLACEFGHDEVARMLISGGAKIDETDSAGWRPLHHAAFSYRPDMVQLLLQRGATPDARTDDGFTALSLGFREQALSPANIDDRNRVTDMLQFAMLGVKKSRFKQFTSGMLPTTGIGRSRTATQRNQVWHTAQLAETLHQADPVQEGEESIHGSAMDEPSLSRQDTGVSELDSTPSRFETPTNESPK